MDRFSVPLIVAAFVASSGAAPAFAGSAAGLLDISTDGRLLACANRDAGTVTIVDAVERTKLREIAVGHQPEGLTFIGDTHRIAVCVYAADEVTFADADSGALLGKTAVFDEPYGVVSDRAGRRVWVTLDYPGRVVEIDAESRAVRREIAAGAFLRGIARTPDSTRLLVTEFLSAAVVAIDIERWEIADRWPGASTDNLLRQIVPHPTQPKAFLPHIRSRVSAAHGEGSVFPYVSVVDLIEKDGTRRRRVPMDALRGNFVVANPWDLDVSPDGKTLWVVFAGTDDLFVCDILDDTYRDLTYRRLARSGRNPRAVRFAPDGKAVWVYDALDFRVTVWEPDGDRPVASVIVCENPLGDEIFAGKRLFYSALEPMVGRRWISCASCHPDGDPDGRTWGNPEGLRNTPSLAGLAWTHPLHWSADRDETQDFEHTVRGPLMQGRGLIRGPVHDSLGTPNEGRSAELDALAAYTNSIGTQLSPHARGGLSEAAQRGKALFESAPTACATCHSGPFFTDSNPRGSNRSASFVRHDVGTGAGDSTETMGTAYDTPALVGIYRTAPYLHDGGAPTLRAVLRECNRDDRHGKTSHLSDAEIDDLVAFLESLPYEAPEPRARAVGLIEVRR